MYRLCSKRGIFISEWNDTSVPNTPGDDGIFQQLGPSLSSKGRLDLGGLAGVFQSLS